MDDRRHWQCLLSRTNNQLVSQLHSFRQFSSSLVYIFSGNVNFYSFLASLPENILSFENASWSRLPCLQMLQKAGASYSWNELENKNFLINFRINCHLVMHEILETIFIKTINRSIIGAILQENFICRITRITLITNIFENIFWHKGLLYNKQM